MTMHDFKIADYGGYVEQLTNRSGKQLFKRVVLEWSKPQDMNVASPFFEESRPVLYIITRNHHAMTQRDRIRYIGLSSNPRNRFQNHPKATALSQMKGKTSLSFAYLDQDRSSKRVDAVKRALEEIEHILIWTLWSRHDLLNDRKMFTLPGMGSKAGTAWHIINSGYRFRGQMPREIVYPWILQKNGRDRSYVEKAVGEEEGTAPEIAEDGAE